MASHYLRFVRVLSGVGALSFGCGGVVSTTSDAASDASTEATADVDTDDAIVVAETSPPEDTATATDVATTGTCRDIGTGIACASPNVCAYDFGENTPDGSMITPGAYCGPPPDGGTVIACGLIGCASPCWCENAAQSICSCQLLGGPLLPPDLPAV